MTKAISADFPFQSKYLSIQGSKLHYIDEGTGDPILFLHGNPTSSYLWRNIIPYLTDLGRCIALDHIGMGKSDKPDIEYGFRDTYKYLDLFITELGLKNITLILHDWGSILGFHYANLHRDNIKAIVFMESSIQAPNFANMPTNARLSIKMVKNPLLGVLLVKYANIFIKKMLPDLIQRELTEEEKKHYASPFPTAKSRQPLLAFPQDVPMNGQPEVVDKVIKDYHAWLKETEIPKLCLYVNPGVALQKEDVELIKKEFRNTKLVYLGEGMHFIQEDYPHQIGQNIVEWYVKIEAATVNAALVNATHDSVCNQ